MRIADSITQRLPGRAARIVTPLRLHTLLLCGVLGLGSCGGRQTNTPKPAAQEVSASKTFRLPEIPDSLTAPEGRADYFMSHYWDHFDFADTTLISRPEITEQAFAEFIDLLSAMPRPIADRALTRMLQASTADSVMFGYFTDLTEKYLYDPNSPMRNEELYIPVLRYLVDASPLDSLFKIRPRHQLELALKNRPGDIATDFTYTLGSGRTSRMSDIRADYTILFFNNPDCSDCNRVKEYLGTSPVIGGMLRSRSQESGAPSGGNKLSVLALYTDQNLPHWRSATYPDGVINAYDAGQKITVTQSYDLKAIPTLYLLDKDKRIILKDAPVEQIEQWLAATQSPDAP